MQVKKFEAPTIQEALDTIKRELGPEAIILHTKQNKKGFGLMSKASVEVTAAVSDRSIQKKKVTESKLPNQKREMLRSAPAKSQADAMDKHYDRLMGAVGKAKEQVSLSKRAAQAATRMASQLGSKVASSDSAIKVIPTTPSKITARKYVEIPDQDEPTTAKAAPANPRANAPMVKSGSHTYIGSNGESVEDEMRQLKRMIVEMKSAQEDVLNGSASQNIPRGTLQTPALQDAFEQLILNGVDKRFAIPLIRKVAFELGDEQAQSPDSVLDQLAGEVMKTTEVISPLNGIEPKSKTGIEKPPVTLALVGPTGVGKTTTIAKIASEAILKRNLKVGLINLDSYKVAAFDQLATYAKILNIPFRAAATAEDLKVAIEDFKNLDVVIIDTAGRSQKDTESLREMETLLHSIPQIQTQLVLSSTNRDTELYDMANRYSIFRPQGIILSKLDEASVFGSIYNISQKTKLPLIYFTTGQRVPEDIEEATQERTVTLIMDL